RPLRPARARPARPQPMETTARDPRLLRHQPVERARRSDQRTPRTPPRHRPGLPEPDPLHLAVPDPLRPASRTHQRTLKPEEPELVHVDVKKIGRIRRRWRVARPRPSDGLDRCAETRTDRLRLRP